MPKSNYLDTAVLNAALRGVAFTPPATLYMSLHTADPTSAALGNTEMVNLGGSTASRQAVTFSAPVANQASSSSTATFLNLPAGTFTHASLWDNPSLLTGNMLYYGPLDASRTLALGDTLAITSTNFKVSEA